MPAGARGPTQPRADSAWFACVERVRDEWETRKPARRSTAQMAKVSRRSPSPKKLGVRNQEAGGRGYDHKCWQHSTLILIDDVPDP